GPQDSGRARVARKHGEVVMQSQRKRWTWAGLAAIAVALATLTVSVSPAQNPPTTKAKGAAKGARAKGKGEPLKKRMPNAADPLQNAGVDPLDKNALAGMVHYRLKLRAFDGTPLALTYCPAFPDRLATNAPVILMVHEKDRSGKDFEEPIA